jgi:hypothetical protein
MTYKDRKILLLSEGWTIQALTSEYKKRKKKTCRREEMSQCIRGIRVYQPLRDFLSELFEKPIAELFELEEEASSKVA